MKKASAWFLLLFLSLAFTTALADDTRVYDQARIFTAVQVAELEREIADFQEQTGMDFVVLTSDEPHEGASQQQIGDQFFLRGGFGFGEEGDGILYYIDMYERYHYLVTHGAMIDYMTDSRIDDAIDSCTRYLSSASYADAVSRMIDIVASHIRSGIPEGQYRYDVVTGQRLTASHKALTPGEMLGSGAIALLVCLCFVFIVQSRYKLKGSTYSYNFREHADVKLTGKEDNFLRTTTSRVRKPDPPKNGGGSFGGGGGGGSGVHSSGGSSFGGGGGRF